MNELKNKELTSDGKVLLMIIKTEGLPSVGDLASQLSWGAPKIKNAIKDLINNGYLTKEKKTAKVTGFQYNYVLTLKGNGLV